MRVDWLEIPHRIQQGDDNSTPACFGMVLAYYGCDVAEPDLCELLGTELPGGTLFQ